MPAPWGEIINEFLLDCSLRGGAKQLAANRRNALRFLVQASFPAPSSIDASMIRRHLAGLSEAKKSDKTIFNVKSSLSRLCEFLRPKYLEHNPCRDVQCKTPERIAPPVIRAANELAAVLAAARSAGCYVQAAVAIYTGLRLAEICRLAWHDVDFAERTLLVRKAKGRRFRVVPMADELRAILLRHKDETGGFAWLFPARQTWTGHWRYIDRPMAPRTLGKRLGPIKDRFWQFRQLPAHSVGNGWHLFRHTYATRLVRHKTPLTDVQDWLGHTDINQTRRYIAVAAGYDPQIEVLRLGLASG